MSKKPKRKERLRVVGFTPHMPKGYRCDVLSVIALTYGHIVIYNLVEEGNDRHIDDVLVNQRAALVRPDGQCGWDNITHTPGRHE